MSYAYKNLMKSVQPSRSEMQRRMKPMIDASKEADKIAIEMVKTSGMSAMELYKQACDKRNDSETLLDREIRISLMGMARKAL